MAKRKETVKNTQEAILPQGEAAPSDGMGAFAEEIMAQAPEVQEGVMRAYEAEEVANAEAAPAPSTEPKKKGRPRKADSELKEPRRVKVPKAPEVAAEPLPSGPDVNRATAELFTMLKEQVTVALIGEEWNLTPTEKAAENALLSQSLDKYAPEGMPVNPLVMYAAVSASHAAKRFSQPKTRTWYETQKTRFAAWWLARKAKKAQKYASHSDNRAHNVGQNNASGGTGGENKGE